MSAFVSFFLLPLTFFSFLLRPLCTMLFMWELLWKRMLFISGFLMSTVAIGRVGPGHMTTVISYSLRKPNLWHTFPSGTGVHAGWARRVCVANNSWFSPRVSTEGAAHKSCALRLEWISGSFCVMPIASIGWWSRNIQWGASQKVNNESFSNKTHHRSNVLCLIYFHILDL